MWVTPLIPCPRVRLWLPCGCPKCAVQGGEAHPSVWDTLRSEEGAQPMFEGGFLPSDPTPPPVLLSKGLYGGD